MKILKSIADRDATSEELAKCIFNLEKAANLLEAAHDTDSDLATEINGELYWARKRSTLAMDAVLDKMRAVDPASEGLLARSEKSGSQEVSRPKTDPAEPGEMVPGLEAATKAFHEAEKFAQAHSDDDYVVGVHWFQMASLHPGTDLSLKALSLAREAQARFQSKNPNAKKEVIPDTPEMKPVVEADALAAQKQYEKAIPLYEASIKLKESAIAHRKLAKAHYDQAQIIKEEVIKKCTTTYDALKTARANATRMIPSIGGGMRRVFNPNDPTYMAALKNFQAAYKEGDAAFEHFDKAQSEFKAALRLAPGGKDLTSAGLIGICISQRPEASNRSRAKQTLAIFLKEYTPGNDDERSIYEYCKTELDRLGKIN